MARIREYTNRVTQLSPSDRGVRAVADLASDTGRTGYYVAQAVRGQGEDFSRAISDFGSSAGEMYTRHVVQPELSKGSAAGAGLISSLTMKWNEAAQKGDINDSALGQRFIQDEVAPALDKFRASFTTAEGQKWANEFSARIFSNTSNKIMSDMSTRAGLALTANIQTTVNQLSSAAQADPSQVDFLMSSAEDAIGTMAKNTPNLPPDIAAKAGTTVLNQAKKEIAMGALVGVAKSNPDLAEKWVNEGKFKDYIDGGEAARYVKAAQATRKAEVAAARAELRERNKAAMNATFNSLLLSTIQEDGSTRVTPKTIQDLKEAALANPTWDQSAVRSFVGAIKRMQNDAGKREAPSDPQVLEQLTLRLRDPDSPLTVTDVVIAYANGEINNKDKNALVSTINQADNKMLRDPAFRAAVDAAKESLVLEIPGTNFKDPEGKTRFANFMNDFIPKAAAAYRANKLEPNAFDMSDPNSFISKSLAPYRRTPEQALRDRMNASSPGAMNSGERITGMQVQTFMFSPSLNKYRDPATGKVYTKEEVDRITNGR